MKYVPVAVKRDLRILGEHASTQRKLLSLTIKDVAQRAGVNPNSVRRLEQGEAVQSDTLFSVMRILQLAQQMVNASDPYKTDVGQTRASEQLPQRVRR